MIVERHGEIAILTLDRPDAMNPLGHKGDGAAIEAICQEITRVIDVTDHASGTNPYFEASKK